MSFRQSCANEIKEEAAVRLQTWWKERMLKSATDVCFSREDFIQAVLSPTLCEMLETNDVTDQQPCGVFFSVGRR